MLLLAVAGISLTASAISWWNGVRTEEVNAQIAHLENKLRDIYAADARARQELAAEYLLALAERVGEELALRDAVATELSAARAKARQILERPFGARESDAFRQAMLELELAESRMAAERAWLQQLQERVRLAQQALPPEIPTPAALEVPHDFPREGGLVHFDGPVPAQLHGYQLQVVDETFARNGRMLLFGVDHERRRVRASPLRAALLEANLADAGEPLTARVQARERDGIRLSFGESQLLLPCRSAHDYAWLVPETDVDCWPDRWTLREVIGGGQDAPLPVRLHPRVGGSDTFWAPIYLAVAAEQLSDIERAEEHFREPRLVGSPWRVHLTGDGAVAFTRGRCTLITEVDGALQAFVLQAIHFDLPRPELSVSCHAQFALFVPGGEEDVPEARTVFDRFVQALHAELAAQKHQLSQRRMALRLRKLSLIYRDQQEHLEKTGSCGFLPGEVRNGGRVVIGVLTGSSLPAWLAQQVGTASPRLRVAGLAHSWPVRRASWEDRSLGICRLELDVPEEASFHEVAPFDLRRLELIGEGNQQQTLSNALENAILGRFVSGAVHRGLLGLSGEPIPHRHQGRDAAANMLADDSEPVVAVWGPPGTGKTTLLVNWLLSLFPPGEETRWPRVLIAAPTHVAVDKLLLDLLAQGEHLWPSVVRYGSADRVAGTPLEPVWHQRLLEGLASPAAAMSEADAPLARRWATLMASRDGRESAARWLLHARNIHAATCVGMARSDFGLLRESFDLAIVDEAGKAFGAELMLPASVTRRLILVGDHHQLPPTVTTETLDEAIGYRLPLAEVRELLQRNAFHDIYEQLPASAKGMLTLQYRMHADIGDAVSELFYDGQVQAARTGGSWRLTRKRLVFADFSRVQGYRHRKGADSDSIENPTERAALHAVLGRLSERVGETPLQLLIICPYQAQREALAQELAGKAFPFSVSLSTVDAVQGGEADLVILLMTRSRGRTEFLLDRHRLNVALSRSREAVVIFGHRACLTRGDAGPVARLIEWGRAKGTLDLIELPEQANFRRSLAPAVVP